MELNRKRTLNRNVSLSFTAVVMSLLLFAGTGKAASQACAAQNWAAATPNIWAATVSDLVMLNNNPTTNQPTIPIMLYDGTYSPWGYSQHPQAVTQLNTNWSCPSGTPVISIAGAGRETVSFQLFITAPAATTLSDVSVTITPLTGTGATLTSDNTGKSEVTRYLEGYVPYSCTGATAIGCVQASGSIPDPLIPFYDPYDPGNPAVATPFNVQQGTTQGVWVNISIPANQTAGDYTGSLTVSGTGISSTTIPVNLTVWNGNLPGFGAGSINSSYADMLKVWLPLRQWNLDSGEGISGSDIPLFQKYQVMAHDYGIDTHFDPFGPSISGAYPSTNPTSFTTNGTTSSIDWTSYDSYFGPSLTPGGLFSDGTAMRAFDTPIANGGIGAWTYSGYSWCMRDCANAPLMPAGLVSLTQNYATQISQHFSSNHSSKNWVIPDLLSYTFDENYWDQSYQLGVDPNSTAQHQPLIYQIISQVDQAINASNSALSPTWAASTAPIRTLMTDEPACMEKGDTQYYLDPACKDHLNLSYPGDPTYGATPGYSTSWVTAWSPSPSLFMTGKPGPGLSYGWNIDPVIITGSGYKYTLDLTEGVPALSTAPVPIERWTYNNGGGGTGSMYRRMTYWAAYKYGLDVTVPSVGAPNPATPAPGGLWSWTGNFWGGYNGTASANSCNSLSPFVTNGNDQGDSYFFPGNELGCYYTANPVGATVLTANPAVNTNCASNGYSVCNGISGPIATRELEQWRRGYEDYEYLYLYGKQSGRAAAEAVVASIAAEGLADWETYDWENTDGSWYQYGVTPEGTAYSGNCTYPSAINSPIFGNLPNGLPNGPTGQGSSGPGLDNDACEGLWSPDPYAYESARIQLAEALGFAPATTPSVTGLSPSSGSNQGGTSVVITGTGFTGATAVEFGGVAATSFTINSSTMITAIAPAGEGTVTVQVFGPSGVSASNPNDLFTNVSPVTVTGLSPNQGLQVGGNTVSITGTDFSVGATVMFGSTPATNVVVNSATSITATAPAGSGTVNVTVTASLGTSAESSADYYTYQPPPTVSSVSPSSGPIAGGTSVTIRGTGFASGMTVHFGGNLGTSVNVTSSTSLTVTSPASSSMSGGIVDITVTTANGTSLVVGGPDQFKYLSPVTVTGLSVHGGPPAGGTSVVITGTGFAGASAVKFGSDPATIFTVNSSTQITATSPAGGGTVDVTVTNSPYSSAPVYADEFSYTSAIKTGVFSTLPTTAVGSTSSTQNVQITLATASAISSITVPLAQNGVQEFKVGTVTGCTIGGGSNAANTVCTVPITFTPQYPGLRMGTLTVNNNNDVIGTAGLAGVGQGPEIAVTPGSLTMAIGGGQYGVTQVPQSVTTAAISVSNNGSGLAMDGAGNLYIADNSGNCMAYKVDPLTNQIVAVAGDVNFAGGRPVPTTTPEPALGSGTCPQAIAVDGAGNVYIGDAHAINSDGYPNLVEEVSQATGEIWVMAGGGSHAPSTTPQAATSVAISAINSLATDTAGNVYISDFFNNLIEKVTPAGQLVVVAGGGSTPVSTTPQAATSAQLNGPTGMVFDAAGNLYVSDQNISKIEKINTSGQIVSFAGGGSNPPTTTPQAALAVALNNPAGLAVDGAGDLYIADFSNNLVEKVNVAGQLVVVAGGGTTVPTSTVQSSLAVSLGNIEGVEVDGAGNIYIADNQNIGNGNNIVEKVTAVGFPLSFPFTNVGSTSVPQSLNLVNIGNQTLTMNSLSATTDFPLQSPGTCAVTATNSQTLASGNNCSVVFAFHPTIGGVLNEAATLTDNSLNASGTTQLLSFSGTGLGGTNVSTPTFSPAAGSYGPAQTITISSATAGATIYYTTNGTTPTTSSTQYTAPITVSTSETVEALAVKTGYTNSAIGSAAYVINGAVATPTFSPAAGSYGLAQTVTINSATAGATIYYTTNGTTPTTSSTQYTAPITVSTSETVEALAVETGYTDSAVGSASYTITGSIIATPTFSPAAGTYSLAQTVTISDATSGATIYYTTNGTTPTTSSSIYSAPIIVSASETVKAIAALVQSVANSDFATTPPMTPGAGTYIYAPTTVSGWTFSGATPNASTGSYGSGVAEYGSAWGFTAAPDGANQVAFLQNNATLTQTIGNLIVGQQYTASFYLEGRPGYSSNPITVTIGGTNLLSTTPGSGWTHYNEPFTATATTETLSFSTTATGGDYDTGLSDVMINAVSPPTSAVASAVYTINSASTIVTVAGVQGGTTNPTNGMVAHGNSIGAPEGVAIAPVINGAGGDIYFDNCSANWNCSYNYNLYVIYEGGAAAKALLAAGGISSPVVGDTYPIVSQNQTGPASLAGLFVDSYGNLLVADWSYGRVYMFYVGEVAGQGTNPADALITADGATWEAGYGLHAGYSYHIADGSVVVGAAPTTILPRDIWVDSAENIFFTDGSGNGFVEVVYNATGTSAATILTAEGYTSLQQGSTYVIAGGQSIATYPYDNDGGSSVAYNGATNTSNTAINNPWGLYGDSAGNIIFADSTSNKIKKLSGTTAVLSTIGGPLAGTQTTVGHGGDGGVATSAQMNGPIGVILDPSGNIYFADSGNSAVRMIGTNGYISTVAGTDGNSGAYSGEGGPATSAVMNTSAGGPAIFLSIDASSNIYISDEGNDMIHKF